MRGQQWRASWRCGSHCVRWARCNGCGAVDSAPQAAAAATVSVTAVAMVAAMMGAVRDEAPCGGADLCVAWSACSAAVGSGGRQRGRAVGSAAVGRGGQRRWWSWRRAHDWQWHGRQRHSRRRGGRPARAAAVGGAVATVAAGGADARCGRRSQRCDVVGAVGAARLASSSLVCTVEDREEDAPPRSLAIGWLSVPGPEPEPRLTAMCGRRRST